MELSLLHSSLPLCSLIKRHGNASSLKTKMVINRLVGKNDYPSSRCSSIFPSSHVLTCSKSLAINERCGSKVIPIRATLGGVEYGFEHGKLGQKTADFGKVLWSFMRPFVVYASLMEFIGILARTWIENWNLVHWSNGSLLIKTLAPLVSILCANVYICGINQIFDVEIDKINKPNLPLAAGALSMQSAWLLVTSYVAIGLLAAGIPNSRLFLALICFQFFLGYAYSVPPLSLKKSTTGAILVCTLIQGFTLVFCLQAAARATLGLPFQLSLPVTFLSIFATLFAFTTGFMKDIHDLEGDKKFNIQTLAAIFGAKNLAYLGCGILLMNYVGAVLAAILMPKVFRRGIMIPVHTLLALSLIFQARKLQKANYNKEQSLAFYGFCWKLFHIEFLLFPFI